MSDLDDLMNIDPLHLTNQDLDKIIEYQRRARASWEAGEKPKKTKPDRAIVSLDTVMQTLKPPSVPSGFKRRI